MKEYALIVHNRAHDHNTICLFQTTPMQEMDVALHSLAWLVNHCNRGETTEFRWTMEYSLLWSDAGTLHPEFRFIPGKAHPARVQQGTNDLGQALDKDLYYFDDYKEGIRSGKLGIFSDHSVPDGEGIAVGIGVSGYPAFVRPALPGMTYTFDPHPKYWVTLGEFERGQIVGMEAKKNAFCVEYDQNECHHCVTLHKDGTWELTQ